MDSNLQLQFFYFTFLILSLISLSIMTTMIVLIFKEGYMKHFLYYQYYFCILTFCIILNIVDIIPKFSFLSLPEPTTACNIMGAVRFDLKFFIFWFVLYFYFFIYRLVRREQPENMNIIITKKTVIINYAFGYVFVLLCIILSLMFFNPDISLIGECVYEFENFQTFFVFSFFIISIIVLLVLNILLMKNVPKDSSRYDKIKRSIYFGIIAVVLLSGNVILIIVYYRMQDSNYFIKFTFIQRVIEFLYYILFILIYGINKEKFTILKNCFFKKEDKKEYQRISIDLSL